MWKYAIEYAAHKTAKALPEIFPQRIQAALAKYDNAKLMRRPAGKNQAKKSALADQRTEDPRIASQPMDVDVPSKSVAIAQAAAPQAAAPPAIAAEHSPRTDRHMPTAVRQGTRSLLAPPMAKSATIPAPSQSQSTIVTPSALFSTEPARGLGRRSSQRQATPGPSRRADGGPNAAMQVEPTSSIPVIPPSPKDDDYQPDSSEDDAPRKKSRSAPTVISRPPSRRSQSMSKQGRRAPVPVPGAFHDPPCRRCRKSGRDCQVQESALAASCVWCGRNHVRCSLSLAKRSGDATEAESDNGAGSDDRGATTDADAVTLKKRATPKAKKRRTRRRNGVRSSKMVDTTDDGEGQLSPESEDHDLGTQTGKSNKKGQQNAIQLCYMGV